MCTKLLQLDPFLEKTSTQTLFQAASNTWPWRTPEESGCPTHSSGMKNKDNSTTLSNPTCTSECTRMEISSTASASRSLSLVPWPSSCSLWTRRSASYAWPATASPWMTSFINGNYLTPYNLFKTSSCPVDSNWLTTSMTNVTSPPTLEATAASRWTWPLKGSFPTTSWPFTSRRSWL